MIQENLEKIKEIIREFLEKTGLDIEIKEIQFSQDSVLSVDLRAEEPQVLIGERGQTLAEIQRLLKIILQRKASLDPPFYVDLDINDYKKKKKDYLREIALSTASEVVLTKKEKQLPPMSAFERKVIHTELMSRPDVETESIGQDPERSVVIKPFL